MRLRAYFACCVLFAACLSSMATNTKRLTVRNVVPFSTMRRWHDVVSVSLTSLAAHPAACPALPRITREHRLPPCPMGLVAVPPLCCIWAGRFITPCSRCADAGGGMRWDSLRHGVTPPLWLRGRGALRGLRRPRDRAFAAVGGRQIAESLAVGRPCGPLFIRERRVGGLRVVGQAHE